MQNQEEKFKKKAGEITRKLKHLQKYHKGKDYILYNIYVILIKKSHIQIMEFPLQ
jgi:hypothetical protein